MIDEQSDGSPPSQEILDGFLRDHRDGGRAEFESWIVRRPELAQDANLLARVRNLFEAWHAAARWNPRQAAKGSLGDYFLGARLAAGQGNAGGTGQHPAANLHEGMHVAHFVLVRRIGEGGQGEVWEAWDESLRRTVALKLLRPDRIDARRQKRFLREARAGGRLHHPSIVTTLDHGVGTEHTWIAQEFVPGSRTLKHFLDEVRAADVLGQGHYSQVAELTAQLADALHTAHEAGVIHRDVKPQNVLIAPDGKPKLTDFGLARVVDDSFASQSGDVVGTWSYMSPEQVQAKNLDLDERTDVFSLGVVLYELLTLRRPFEGDTTQQIATKILNFDPPDPSRIRSQCPRDLAIIAAKALEKDRGQRYASAAEFAADLRRHLAYEPIHAVPPTRIQRATKWMRRHPTTTLAAIAALVVLAAVTWSVAAVSRAESERLARSWQERRVQLVTALDQVFETESLRRVGSTPRPALDEWQSSAAVLAAHGLQVDVRFGARLRQLIGSAPHAAQTRDVLDQIYRATLPLQAALRSAASGTSARIEACRSQWAALEQAIDSIEPDPWRRRTWLRLQAPLALHELQRSFPPTEWHGRSAADLEWLGLQIEGQANDEYLRDLLRVAYAKDERRFFVNRRLAQLTSGWERRLHSYTALALQPRSSVAHYDVAWNAHNVFDDQGAAREHYRRAIELNPTLAPAYLNLSYLLPDDEALQLLEGAHGCVEPDARFFARYASALQFAGRCDEAIATCDAGLDYFPDDAWLNEILGTCVSKDDRERAIECFERSVATDPYRWMSWFNMGLCLREHAYGLAASSTEHVDHMRRSCHAFEWALALRPDDPQSLGGAGAARFLIGDLEVGVELLAAAAPHNKEARANLAQILASLEHDSTAFELVATARKALDAASSQN